MSEQLLHIWKGKLREFVCRTKTKKCLLNQIFQIHCLPTLFLKEIYVDCLTSTINFLKGEVNIYFFKE